jgi:hypothetical protein
MFACIVLRAVASPAKVEELAFDFVDRLGRFCDSISSCQIVVTEAPDARAHSAWRLQVCIKVFGQDVEIAASGLESGDGRGLALALEDAFAQSRTLLDRIAPPNCGCSRQCRIRARAGDSRARLDCGSPSEGC